ncbi:MAG TPA: TetR/AcrR family transcriptional regulator, partial [Phytomonospora sp.]
MWGVRERSSRGPKQGLTIEAIVRTAIALADAEGLAALSMRKVAERLGVGTMSLYTYVPGKPELLDLMLDAAI